MFKLCCDDFFGHQTTEVARPEIISCDCAVDDTPDVIGEVPRAIVCVTKDNSISADAAAKIARETKDLPGFAAFYLIQRSVALQRDMLEAAERWVECPGRLATAGRDNEDGVSPVSCEQRERRSAAKKRPNAERDGEHECPRECEFGHHEFLRRRSRILDGAAKHRTGKMYRDHPEDAQTATL